MRLTPRRMRSSSPQQRTVQNQPIKLHLFLRQRAVQDLTIARQCIHYESSCDWSRWQNRYRMRRSAISAFPFFYHGKAFAFKVELFLEVTIMLLQNSIWSGRIAYRRLKEQPDLFEVRGMVRSSGSKERIGGGDDVFMADITNHEALPNVLVGIDALIILTSSIPKMKASLNPSLGHRPEFFFDEGCYPEQVWKRKSEEYLRDSGVPYTIIRAGLLEDAQGRRRELLTGSDDELMNSVYRR